MIVLLLIGGFLFAVASRYPPPFGSVQTDMPESDKERYRKVKKRLGLAGLSTIALGLVLGFAFLGWVEFLR